MFQRKACAPLSGGQRSAGAQRRLAARSGTSCGLQDRSPAEPQLATGQLRPVIGTANHRPPLLDGL